MSIIERLKKYYQKLQKRPEPFDPHTLKDSIALKTGWEPIKKRGNRICTHVFKQISLSRAGFKMSITAWVLILFSLTLGGLGSLLFIYSLAADMNLVPFSGVLALVFTVPAVFKLRRWSVPRIFDRTLGYYWKARKEPDFIRKIKPAESCRIGDIHAIQLLEEEYGSSDERRVSYEINLVLKTGNRINVVDHGRERVIRRDARELARFLKVPVWNAIRG